MSDNMEDPDMWRSDHPNYRYYAEQARRWLLLGLIGFGALLAGFAELIRGGVL